MQRGDKLETLNINNEAAKSIQNTVELEVDILNLTDQEIVNQSNSELTISDTPKTSSSGDALKRLVCWTRTDYYPKASYSYLVVFKS